MKIWLTGHDVGVGRWLAEHLDASHELYRSSWNDTYPRSAWGELLESSKADVLVHAAELPNAHECRADPIEAATVNAGWTAVLAQAASSAVPTVQFVYLSSAEASEGRNLYGLSKLWGEQAATLSAPGCQIIRLWNVYGPSLPHTIPTRMFETALAGDTIYVHEQMQRSFLYVADAVRAIRLIIEDGRGGIWNVGGRDDDVSMRDLAEQIVEMVGDGRADESPTGAGIAPLTRFPDTTALAGLGWVPEVPLAEGLRRTHAWYVSLEEGVQR